MEMIESCMSSLFAQLGEADSDQAIKKFIDLNGGLPGSTHLHEASFWSPSQANFLREAKVLDSTWSQVVDELNVKLHD
jgi:hypothetical protein